MRNRNSDEAGFTLLEILVALVLVSLMFLALAPAISFLGTMEQRSYEQRQSIINQQLASAVRNAAATTPSARINAPFGTGENWCADNEENILALTNDVIVTELCDDGTRATGDRGLRRRLEITSTVEDEIPFFPGGGEVWTLEYQLAAIYLDCESLAISSRHCELWDDSDGIRLAEVRLSNRTDQLRRLNQTRQRVQGIRTAMQDYFRAGQISSPADNLNYFPGDSSMNSFIELDSSEGLDLLRMVGLSSEYARTTWGDSIRFCRDFNGSSCVSDSGAPYYGAIQIPRPGGGTPMTVTF